MYQDSHCIEVMGMCRRMAGKEFSDHCVMKSVKHGGGMGIGVGFFDKF